MPDHDDLPEVDYPPAPWRSHGEVAAALFTTRQPPRLPMDLRPLGRPDRLALILVRYRTGTLRYDELIVGSLVRRGIRAGMWIHFIWVDDTASLWGGRRIWHLPKNLARFDWTGESVRITDREGPIATLTVRQHWLRLPPAPLAATAFSGYPQHRLCTVGHLLGNMRGARVEVTDWSQRLPRLCPSTSRAGITIRPCRLVVSAPSILRPARTAVP
jgi:hypothetical protein